MNTTHNLILSVELPGSPGKPLLLDVREFDVVAIVSRPFEISLEVMSPDPALDLEALIGQSASFIVALREFDLEAVLSGDPPLEGHEARVWSGVIREVQHLSTEPDGLSKYAVELVPELWLLTQRTNNSIFQYQSEVEIVEHVCQQWGIDVHLDPRELERGGVDLDAHRRREYRTQYEETDFDFVNRMLEESGIAYFFDSSCKMRGAMVLSDAPQAAPPRSRSLAYEPEPNTVAGMEWATDVRFARRVAPGKVSLVDHDFRRPPLVPIIATAEGGQNVEQRLDVFEYRDGHFLYITGDAGDPEDPADQNQIARTDLSEGQTLARKRLRAQRARAKETQFRSNALDLDVGQVVRIEGHPRVELEREGLLLTELRFSGSSHGAWELDVTGVGAAEDYRPPLCTPRPVASGVESATIVGGAGKEIDSDKHGRVKVFFHWDRDGKPDEHSSCWIHVSQPLGGAGFGGCLLPRIGQEVLVSFLGSDPDRPIIVGRYYTSLQMPPRKFPAEQDAFVIRSNSLGGGGGANELCMRDVENDERFDTVAQKNRSDLTKNNRASTIRNDEDKSVGNDRTENIGNLWSVDVGYSTVFTTPYLCFLTDFSYHQADDGMAVQAKYINQTIFEHYNSYAKTILDKAEEKIELEAGAEIHIKAPKIVLVAGSARIELSDAGIQLTGAEIHLN